MSAASPDDRSGLSEDASHRETARRETAGSVAADVPPGVMARARRWVEHSPLVDQCVGLYQRYEYAGAAAFFFGGVAWDAATLTRIDLWVDNGFLLAYLLALGALLCVATLAECDRIESARLLRYRAWYPAAIQFFMGALFSAYVIYYSQSASLTHTSVFLLVLVALLAANEFLHRRLTSLYLRFGLYFMACFSFSTFFIPVLTARMGYHTFVAGGAVSLFVVGVMLTVLKRRGAFSRVRQYAGAMALPVVLFGLMNVFYLQSWIPPVPLSMRAGSVAHEARWEGGNVHLRYERPAWYQFWRTANPVFHRTADEPVYCFTAVFAPAEFRKQLYHVWQHFDADRGRWMTTDRISYDIRGGRGGGYRGYTLKRNVRPGDWRVDVETGDGFLVGRVDFRIKNAPAAPAAVTTAVYE